jgi:hypothetical protein
VFVTFCHIHPSLIFTGNAGAHSSGGTAALHSKNRLLVLPAIIILGRKWLTVTNVLAYYAKELITVVKSIIIVTSVSVF